MTELLKERYEEHIISTPTNICGIYETDGLSIIPMFHQNNGILSDRNYYVVRILNDGGSDDVFEVDEAGIPIKGRIGTGAPTVKELCIILSVVFGKRFQYNGLLKQDSSYRVPDFNSDIIKHRFLTTHNDNERVDKLVDMNWTKMDVLLDLINSRDIENFINASYYYSKALINVSYDIEVAYIDLVRAIEILSDEIIEEDSFTGELDEIYGRIKDEPKLASYFRKYHGSTKKFIKTILGLIGDDEIRNRKEAIRDNFSLVFIKSEKREEVIRNSYTIRSNYVHAGLEFASYALPDKGGMNELLRGSPGVITPLNKCLQSQTALNFSGLERLVRWTLLKYLENLPLRDIS